jgi:outer membrane protein assembly factor BamB
MNSSFLSENRGTQGISAMSRPARLLLLVGILSAPLKSVPTSGAELSPAAILKHLGSKGRDAGSAAQVAAYGQHFNLTDLNRDGRLSREEYVDKGRYLNPQSRAGIFRASDSNANGFVSRDEYVMNRRITDEAKAIMAEIDVDRNGQVTRDEFLFLSGIPDNSVASAIFEQLDANGDGSTFTPEYLRVWGAWARALPAEKPERSQPVKDARGDWPWWRGPNHNGIAEIDQQPPVAWGPKQNIAWQTPVPGRGHSSPTVVGERIFLTTADEDAKTQSVLCFQRQNGSLLWQREVNRGGFPRRIHRKNTHASPTIAVANGRLFAVFYHHGGIQVAALDLNGKPLWNRNAGNFAPKKFEHGYGASPVLHGNSVIIAGDFDGDAYLTALDQASGKPLWKTKRASKCNYATPIVGHVAGRDQLLLSGGDLVAGYDPDTGKSLWQAKATTMANVGTMVWNRDLVFASGGYPKPGIYCLRADGSGEILWRNTQKVYEQSMLVHDSHLYAVTDAGIAYCWKTETGETLWQERLRGPISASPILVGDHIYIFNERGAGWIIRATPERFQVVAKNELGAEVFATPSFCGNQIFFRVANKVEGRRQESLYCIQSAPGS